MRPLPLLLLLLAALAAAAPAVAAAEDPPAPPPAPAEGAGPDPEAEGTKKEETPEPEPPAPPLFARERPAGWDLRGGFEPGFRFVAGKEGRYAQDVNLDGGVRLLSAGIEGVRAGGGGFADLFALRLSGLGDPDSHASFEARSEDAFDLRLHGERQQAIFRATADPHPFDTVRYGGGGRLSFHLARNLEAHVSEDVVVRRGDAAIRQRYRDDQDFPVAQTVDYRGLFHSVGVDGSSGAFRFGGSWSWSRSVDDSLRVLDRPDTPIRDTGTFRDRADVNARTAAARAGVRLWKGTVDLEVLGSWSAAETDARIRGVEAVSTPNPPNQWYSDLHAQTESNARGWTGRADLLVRPGADWEILGRHEATSRGRIGGGAVFRREQGPVFDPNLPYFREPLESRTDADLRRDGLEARWRASRAWRFRAGAEEVKERIDEDDVEDHAWSPTTVAATAGLDWTPSERFDASILGRGARARSAATALSADQGDWLSVRLRARRPDGWHATGFLRLKQRSEDSADAFATYDSYGYAFGHSDEDGFAELSITRQDFTFASDARFVQDGSVSFARSLHRVRYDEAVTGAAGDFSRRIHGPVRVFGSERWADANGDAPYVQSDLSLGLGWRFAKYAEFRVEGRRIAFHEKRRNPDDYRANLLTVSFAYEF